MTSKNLNKMKPITERPHQLYVPFKIYILLTQSAQTIINSYQIDRACNKFYSSFKLLYKYGVYIKVYIYIVVVYES